VFVCAVSTSSFSSSFYKAGKGAAGKKPAIHRIFAHQRDYLVSHGTRKRCKLAAAASALSFLLRKT